MHKHLPCILIILSLLLLLTGCKTEVAPLPETTAPAATELPTETSALMGTAQPAESTSPTEAPTEAPTEVPTEAPTEAPVTEPAPTEAEDSGLPYLQQINRADQSIYAGPGYDYVFAGTVRERGTYTIVEESWDYEGNLWGKLKSGAGWVDLTEIRSEDYANALISANFAEESLLLHGDYHYCPSDDLEYSIPIAFRAYSKLRDVQLCAFDFSGDDFAMGEAFFTLPEMSPDKPLVADLAFPGDMSMYGIRFVDENGVTHVYSIYISGRNGALVLSAND